jgi:hypothetical protein
MSICSDLSGVSVAECVMRADVRQARREEAAVTLARTARELRKAVGMVEDLEQVVCLAIALAGEADAEQMLELQKLDHIQQKILGVADFLDALSETMPSEWRVDAKGASRRVLLAELGARLGDPEAANATPAAAEVDTYELF